MRRLFGKELGSRPALLAYTSFVVWCMERKVDSSREENWCEGF